MFTLQRIFQHSIRSAIKRCWSESQIDWQSVSNHSSTMLITFTLIVQLVPTSGIEAEFRCQSKVSYSVEFTPVDALEKKEEKALSPVGVSDRAKDDKVPVVPVESTVTTAQLDVTGEDEPKAKEKLLKMAGRHVDKARTECREKHENTGACLGAKFEANATVLRTADFSARKRLEESLVSDCNLQRGRCKNIAASEPVCTEIVKPVAEAAGAEGEVDGAKDDKKKDKKKGKK